MDTFVHEQNLIRFAGLFEQEPDAAKRHVLKDLLIGELDALASGAQRLRALEFTIRHVQRQRERRRASHAPPGGDGVDPGDVDPSRDIVPHLLQLLDDRHPFPPKGATGVPL